MKKEIKGKFVVKGSEIEPSSVTKELGLLHMKFEKRFEGELNATGLVSMMGLMNKEIGSGGYVALEKIIGEIGAKKGTFYLQHSSTMLKGTPKQTITVVPDTGTNELKGIKGEMVIDIIDGQHFYTFNYEF